MSCSNMRIINSSLTTRTRLRPAELPSLIQESMTPPPIAEVYRGSLRCRNNQSLDRVDRHADTANLTLEPRNLFLFQLIFIREQIRVGARNATNTTAGEGAALP